MSDWIDWPGKVGNCPVLEGVTVRIRCRDGWEYTTSVPKEMQWLHTDTAGDILAYKILGVREKAQPTALQEQEGGDHYKKYAIQPMEYSMANKLDACQHTVVKYVTRFRDKNGIEDLKKAIHTLRLLAQLEYKENI